ncbi:uncharacterized protein LOC134203957 [Armigeres subalbatus]|uniref:uncharacterized protein LOC134203957 n=1 Tax=Armigeres subalbatus TaxID=124917 RepID=UPI002ED64709
MALRNFISRRGRPRTFHSDRGTNFVGANREIKAAEITVDHEEMMKEFVDSETSWHFHPPSSPHIGGSWERLIGCVKKNLMAILQTRKLTHEVLRNSRPLTHVPVEHSAPALTPNHFLLESSKEVKPLCTMDDSGTALRWRLSQLQANRFWQRWVSDYLPEITRRTKWFTDTKPIENDDVLLASEAIDRFTAGPAIVAFTVADDSDRRPANLLVQLSPPLPPSEILPSARKACCPSYRRVVAPFAG